MQKFYKDKSKIMIAIVAIIIIVIIAITAGDRVRVSRPESVVGSLFKPATLLASRIVNFVQNSVSGIAEIGSLKERNEILNQQTITLRAQVREVEALRQENRRLREMLDFKDTHPQFDLIGANIIGKDPDNILSVFVIDKGMANGVYKNMPVVTNKGLVGQVMEAGNNWAKVLPICDRRSSVSIIINRTRDAGILKGSDTFKLIGRISPEATVLEDDEVVSAGMGGIYPKGLMIGKISSIEHDGSMLLKKIVVEPAVSFEKLEEVFIIKHTSDIILEGETRD